MDTKSLDGSNVKLRRAEQHLSSFKEKVEEFLASNPFVPVLEQFVFPDDQYWDMRVRRDKEPPLEWSGVVGDFAHNARSALDLMVYQLSNLDEGDSRRYKLEFPICVDPEKYGKAKRELLAGVDEKYVRIIGEPQPYKNPAGPDADPLTLLQDINNTDKHRLLNLVSAVATFRGIRLGPDLSPSMEASIPHRCDFALPNGFSYQGIGDGIIRGGETLVARLAIPMGMPVGMHPEVGDVQISFGEGAMKIVGRPVIDTLTAILARVTEVVHRVETVI